MNYTEKGVRSDEITEDNGIIHRCDRGDGVDKCVRKEEDNTIYLLMSHNHLLMLLCTVLSSWFLSPHLINLVSDVWKICGVFKMAPS